jgi:hypothetical protein
MEGCVFGLQTHVKMPIYVTHWLDVLNMAVELLIVFVAMVLPEVDLVIMVVVF